MSTIPPRRNDPHLWLMVLCGLGVAALSVLPPVVLGVLLGKRCLSATSVAAR